MESPLQGLLFPELDQESIAADDQLGHPLRHRLREDALPALRVPVAPFLKTRRARQGGLQEPVIRSIGGVPVPVGCTEHGDGFRPRGRRDVERPRVGRHREPARPENGGKLLESGPREKHDPSSRPFPDLPGLDLLLPAPPGEADTQPREPHPKALHDSRPEGGIHLLRAPGRPRVHGDPGEGPREKIREDPLRGLLNLRRNRDHRPQTGKVEGGAERGAHHPEVFLADVTVLRTERDLPVGEQQVRLLPHPVPVEPEPKGGARETRDHTALGVSLYVERGVVASRAEGTHGPRHLPARLLRRPFPPPPPDVQGDDPSQPRVPLENCGEPVVHRPVHLRAMSGPRQEIDDRERVDDIPQRRKLHDQDPTKPGRNCPALQGPRPHHPLKKRRTCRITSSWSASERKADMGSDTTSRAAASLSGKSPFSYPSPRNASCKWRGTGKGTRGGTPFSRRWATRSSLLGVRMVYCAKTWVFPGLTAGTPTTSPRRSE